MADDKSKRGGRDRSQVSGGETYEVDYFAEQHDMSREEAQALIDEVGNERAKLDAAVAERAGDAPEKPAPAPARKPRATRAPAKKAPKDDSLLASSVEAVESAADAVIAPIDKVVRPAARKAAAATGKATAATGKAATAATDKVTASTRKAAAATGKAATAATDSVTAATGKAATATKRGAKKVSDTVAKAPAALLDQVAQAGDAVKSAATGRAASMVGAAAVGLVTGLALNLGRKFVVQAPSALAGDWFDAVKVEHKLALALFDALQATSDEDTGKRTVLLTQLKHALGKHAFTEENVLYPALRAWGDTTDADKLNHDHGYVKQFLYDLENMDNASSAFLPKVAEFRAQIEEHIREEEDTIFPPLHAALGDAKNAKVTAQANKEGFKLA